MLAQRQHNTLNIGMRLVSRQLVLLREISPRARHPSRPSIRRCFPPSVSSRRLGQTTPRSVEVSMGRMETPLTCLVAKDRFDVFQGFALGFRVQEVEHHREDAGTDQEDQKISP